MFNPQFVLSILLWQNNEFSYLKTNKGSFGTRTNWCVLNKELCTTGMASRGHTLRPWDLELEARRSLYPEPRSHDRFKPGASWVNRVTTMNLMHYVRDFGPEEFVVTPATVSVPNQHRNDSTSPCNSNTHLCTEDFFEISNLRHFVVIEKNTKMCHLGWNVNFFLSLFSRKV